MRWREKVTITNETFQRAFPEWRLNAQVGWMRERWDGGVGFRWVDDLVQPSGDILGSEFYTDLRLSYSMNPDRDGFRFTVGVNNVFDNDPAICLNTCGTINMSNRFLLSISFHSFPSRLIPPNSVLISVVDSR